RRAGVVRQRRRTGTGAGARPDAPPSRPGGGPAPTDGGRTPYRLGGATRLAHERLDRAAAAGTGGGDARPGARRGGDRPQRRRAPLAGDRDVAGLGLTDRSTGQPASPPGE